jgi:hypothetical protein
VIEGHPKGAPCAHTLPGLRHQSVPHEINILRPERRLRAVHDRNEGGRLVSLDGQTGAPCEKRACLVRSYLARERHHSRHDLRKLLTLPDDDGSATGETAEGPRLGTAP